MKLWKPLTLSKLTEVVSFLITWIKEKHERYVIVSMLIYDNDGLLSELIEIIYKNNI